MSSVEIVNKLRANFCSFDEKLEIVEGLLDGHVKVFIPNKHEFLVDWLLSTLLKKHDET